MAGYPITSESDQEEHNVQNSMDQFTANEAYNMMDITRSRVTSTRRSSLPSAPVLKHSPPHIYEEPDLKIATEVQSQLSDV